MHALGWLGLIVFGCAGSALAQETCNRATLQDSAEAVTAIRHTLQAQSVPSGSPAIPAPLRTQLRQFKDKLATTAEAAFACADASATPDTLQQALTTALHITEPSLEETGESRGKRDYGAYGGDLAVQVFQLFGHPKFFEVDFRWGVECGDDHLLLVFESAAKNPSDSWRERLRWSAPDPSSSADSLGDFIMLTPLTGNVTAPTWRFLVAHGHPGCASGPRPSHFDLDLLTPTNDPARPRVDWHFTHAYVQDFVEPSLSTTENTINFRIVHRPIPGQAATPVPAPDVFRFHLTADGRVEASPGTPGEAQGAATAMPTPLRSPQ